MHKKQYNTYIPELHLANLTQGTHNLPANFIRNVELGQGHVRRAEESVLRDPHRRGSSTLAGVQLKFRAQPVVDSALPRASGSQS